MNAADDPKRHGALPPGAWRIVGLLVAFSFMSWFNRVSMAVAYDTSIGPDDHVSEEAIGTVYSAFFLSYLLFMTPGGWLIDRFGPKRSLLVMGLGSGFFMALTSVAGLPFWKAAGLLVTGLLIARLAMGLFSAPIYPAAARMVAAWIPIERRTFANGVIQSAALVGIACAFPLFGVLVDSWGWPAAFLMSGTVTTLLAVLWWLYAADRPESSPKHSAFELGVLPADPPTSSANSQAAPSWFALLRNRNVMLLTISYAAVGYLEYLFFFWMNHYFGTILQLAKEQSRLYTAVLYLAMAVGIASGGWIADWLRRRFGPWSGCALVPMAGMTSGAIFLGFGIISQEIAWIVFWLSLALLAVGAAEGPVWTAAVEFGGRYGATAAGIVNTGGNLGGFIAPFLTPIVAHAVRDSFALSDQTGWQWGIALAGIFCLSGTALWWWIRPDDKGSRW